MTKIKHKTQGDQRVEFRDLSSGDVFLFDTKLLMRLAHATDRGDNAVYLDTNKAGCVLHVTDSCLVTSFSVCELKTTP